MNGEWAHRARDTEVLLTEGCPLVPWLKVRSMFFLKKKKPLKTFFINAKIALLRLNQNHYTSIFKKKIFFCSEISHFFVRLYFIY